MSCCCIPVRFTNTDGKPISDVHWVHKDILDASRLNILVRHDSDSLSVDDEKTDLELREFDVLSVSSSLIGRFLVRELKIKRHTPKPKSLWQTLVDKTHDWRKSNPVLSVLIGAFFCAVLVGIFFWLVWPVLQLVFEHPLASMVWIWAKLADNLDLIVLTPMLYFVIYFWMARRFVVCGVAGAMMVFAVFVAGAIEFGIQMRLDEAAQWPGSYRIAGEAMRDDAIAAAKGWADWLEPTWPMIAVLLNAAGLTLVAGFLDKALPWARQLVIKPKGVPVRKAGKVVTLAANRLPLAGPTPSDPILDAEPTVKDRVPIIPAKPFNC